MIQEQTLFFFIEICFVWYEYDEEADWHGTEK